MHGAGVPVAGQAVLRLQTVERGPVVAQHVPPVPDPGCILPHFVSSGTLDSVPAERVSLCLLTAADVRFV